MAEVKEKQWYTVKVRNNHENKVVKRINLELERDNLVMEIVVPKEKEIYVKKGKKAAKEKLLYPGYIFVRTDNVGALLDIVRMSEGATTILKDTDGKPMPLRRNEVKAMLLAEEELHKPISDEHFAEGQVVKILTGPFQGFEGAISEMDHDKNKLKVLVNIFKKETPVELTFDDIDKI